MVLGYSYSFYYLRVTRNALESSKIIIGSRKNSTEQVSRDNGEKEKTYSLLVLYWVQSVKLSIRRIKRK